MRILFFAQLKNAAGRASLDWPGTGPCNVEEFWQRLLRECPGLAPYRTAVRLARNWEYAPTDATLQESDEIALIPPVSGG